MDVRRAFREVPDLRGAVPLADQLEVGLGHPSAVVPHLDCEALKLQRHLPRVRAVEGGVVSGGDTGKGGRRGLSDGTTCGSVWGDASTDVVNYPVKMRLWGKVRRRSEERERATKEGGVGGTRIQLAPASSALHTSSSATCARAARRYAHRGGSGSRVMSKQRTASGAKPAERRGGAGGGQAAITRRGNPSPDHLHDGRI